MWMNQLFRSGPDPQQPFRTSDSGAFVCRGNPRGPGHSIDEWLVPHCSISFCNSSGTRGEVAVDLDGRGGWVRKGGLVWY